jgi:hypothetical protein
MILDYESVRDKPKTLRAMTSLDPSEFEELCNVFSEVWDEHTHQHEKDPAKGGRKPILKTIQDRLFFILFYLKVYPLQEVLAHLFGMSQGQANFQIYELSTVLRKTLEKMGNLPARIPEEMLAKLAEEEDQDFGIDGTERRIERPKDPVYQKRYYSGKKKAHTIKNNLVVGLDDIQIKYLSKTHEGKKHDKKICDEDKITVPEKSNLYRDSGFQGHDLPGVTIHQPKKKPRGGELSVIDKVQNRLISSVRVVVEHVIAGVKRCRIVKDIFRNTKEAYDDMVMELACGLHNFRSEHRLLCY